MSDFFGKVSYRMLNGRTSTAYLDTPPGAEEVFSGENTYTDSPVHVRWDDDEAEWVEVAK